MCILQAGQGYDYLVQWKDFPYDASTWQPETNLTADDIRGCDSPAVTAEQLANGGTVLIFVWLPASQRCRCPHSLRGFTFGCVSLHDQSVHAGICRIWRKIVIPSGCQKGGNTLKTVMALGGNSLSRFY